MAELIDKKSALNALNDVSYGNFNYVTARNAIDCIRTTTEAEIRAKAYERFAEKLKESLLKNYRHFITTDTDGFDWLTTDAVGTHIDKVVDQLKEG